MKLRAFAAAWTVFTALAAPALLLAADEPAPAQPEVDPGALEQAAPPAEPAPLPEPTAQAAPAPPPPPEPAGQKESAQRERATVKVAETAEEPDEDSQRVDRKPKARAAASTTVTITDFEFAPTSVSINVGDSVTWVNQGPTVHTATGDGFDTGNLSKGQSGSHTFTSAGSFAYICTPHPFMKATVTVAASSSTGSGDEAADDTGAVATTDADDGPSLADTGSNAWALALIGTGLLSLGVAVRRRAGSS